MKKILGCTVLAALLTAGGTNARPFRQALVPPPPTTSVSTAPKAQAAPLPPAVMELDAAPTEGDSTQTLLEATQAQAEIANAQVNAAQVQLEVAQAQASFEAAQQEFAGTLSAQSSEDPVVTSGGFGGGGGGFGGGGGMGANTFSFTAPEPPQAALVIRSSETKSDTLAAMKEDLNIMGRILEKAISKSDHDEDQFRAMGIRLNTIVTRSGAPKYFQIEGTGALFLLNVDFALMGPPEKSAAEKTNAPANSTWNEAKREIYGRPEGEAGPSAAHHEFDSKRVDKLKTTLLEALKNAANMRLLPGSETVTVVISSGATGAGHGGFSPMGAFNFDGNGGGFSYSTGSTTLFGASGTGTGTVNGSGSSLGGGGTTSVGTSGTSNGAEPDDATAPRATSTPKPGHDRINRMVRRAGDKSPGGNGTMLTIRVAKSDVDAYANGSIDLGEFRKKATITIY